MKDFGEKKKKVKAIDATKSKLASSFIIQNCYQTQAQRNRENKKILQSIEVKVKHIFLNNV